MKFEWKWVNKLFCTWRKRATQFCIILSSILLLRPASEHQRASWEHPNLGEENLNIPLASDYPWIGLRPAQDSPFHLGLHSIFGTYFHIWKTIDGKYGIEGYAEGSATPEISYAFLRNQKKSSQKSGNQRQKSGNQTHFEIRNQLRALKLGDW